MFNMIVLLISFRYNSATDEDHSHESRDRITMAEAILGGALGVLLTTGAVIAAINDNKGGGRWMGAVVFGAFAILCLVFPVPEAPHQEGRLIPTSILLLP
jgi:hypothetical protein